MVKIKNQSDLREYINTIANEEERVAVARAVAYRCSLRVLPLVIYDEDNLKPHHLSVFRALALTGCYQQISLVKLHAAAVAANIATDDAVNANAGVVAAAAAAAADAASADTIATHAATIAATSIAAATASVAADAAAIAADTADAYTSYNAAVDKDAISIASDAAEFAFGLPASFRIGGEIWKEILYDLQQCEQGHHIKNTPLWQLDKMPQEISKYWEIIQEMAQDQYDEGWWIWIDFYKAALQGNFNFFNDIIDLFNTWKRKDWNRAAKDINHDIITALSVSKDT